MKIKLDPGAFMPEYAHEQDAGPKPDNAALYGVYSSGKARTWEDSYSRSAKVRSKTFPGIAQAMAEQWG